MGRLGVTVEVMTSRLGLSECVSVNESSRPTQLLVLRYVAFLLCLGVVFWGIEVTPSFYFFQLTHWAALLTTLYFTGTLAVYTSSSLKPIIYLLFELTLPLEFVITATFWTLMYPSAHLEVSLTYSLAVHGGLLVLLLADYVLNRIRFIRRHCWGLVGLIGVYTVVSFIVTMSLHPIYGGLTYRDLSSYLSILFLAGLNWAAYRLCEYSDRYKFPFSPVTEAGTVLQDFS